MKNYTPYYITKYLEYFKKAKISEYNYKYLSRNSWSLTHKQSENCFVLNKIDNTLHCSCLEFRIGIYLCQHILVSVKLLGGINEGLKFDV